MTLNEPDIALTENQPAIETSTLNPAQQRVLQELREGDKPTFRKELQNELKHELETALSDILQYSRFTRQKPLNVSKRDLTKVHGCKSNYLAEKRTEFEWSVPVAKGSIAHKAIEISINYRGNPHPADLVNEAISNLEESEYGLGPFLQSLQEAERSELASLAVDFVSNFTETFPPLKKSWRPVTESRAAALFCDDAVILRGRVDLSLGTAQGTTAGKVLIDLKTGSPNSSHAEDLRFYALLETLKLGVPPRLISDYYLESGTPRSVRVTEDTLWAALRRVIDGVEAIVALQDLATQDAPKAASSNCKWCPINSSCDTGKLYLEELRASED